MKSLVIVLITACAAYPLEHAQAVCAPAPPSSSVYSYTVQTCRVRTLEEAEAIVHGGASDFLVSELAFTIAPNFYASPGAGVSLDYRPNGAIVTGSSVLTGGAQTVSPAYSVFARGWTSTSPELNDQVALAQSQFDATWHSSPLYSWTRQGAATSTNQISGPPRQVIGVGNQAGALVFAPTSSTASGWGSTITINATQSTSLLAGSDGTQQSEAPDAVTSSSFIWNVQRQDDIACPAGATIRSGATSAGDACQVPFSKIFIAAPLFNQTSGACGVGDPCFPSNGNNLVIEKGFAYGHISLEMYYNSLRQTRPYSYIDRNWSHSLAKRVVTEWSTNHHMSGGYADNGHPEDTTYILVQDEQANQEVFAAAENIAVPPGGYAFRSTSTLGNVLIYQPGSGSAPHFWELDRADGNIEIFDRTGRLTQIVHPDDPRKNLSLTYLGPPLPTVPVYSAASTPVEEAFWRIGQVQDGTGRAVTFEYSNDQYLWLTNVVADDGTQLLHLDFDTAHRLDKLTFADSSYRQYLYNEAANIFVGGTTPPGIVGYWLTGVKDEAGRRYSTFKYDDWGRVVANWHGYDAEKVTLAYAPDLAASSTTVTMPTGRVVTYSYAANQPYRHMESQSDAAGSRSYEYDPISRRKAESVDPNGNITKFEYDTDSVHVKARTEAFGTPQQRRTETDWDPLANRLLEERVYAKPNNGAASLESKLTFAYDAGTGRLNTTTKTDPANGATRRWTNTYCATTNAVTGCVSGLLQAVDGPRTDTVDKTTYKYYTSTDLSGCSAGSGAVCHHMGDLASVTNALGHVTTYVSYDRAGRVTRMKDTNFLITDYEYTARGWMHKRIVRANADGTPSASGDATTRFDHDLSGMVSKTTDPDGVYLAYTYDDAHRITKITDRFGNSIDYCPGGASSTSCLNANGDRRVEQTKDSTGNLARSLGRTYDTLGRLKEVLNANNLPVVSYGAGSYDANGNPVVSTDGNGVRTKMEYDPLNRLQSLIQDFNGTDLATSNTRTEYAYDTRDNLRSVKDPDLLSTTYTYDGLDNLKVLGSPDTGAATSSYDGAGNLTNKTDARGKQTSYTYDAINRPKTRTYPTASTLNVTYTYDTVNPDCAVGEQSAKGRLTRMQDASGETRYCYGGHGNLRRKMQTTTGTTLTTLYTYTVGDRLTSITYPSGAVVTYGLDLMGRPSSVNWKASAGATPVTIVSSTTYYPFGPVNVLEFGSGRALTKLYDQDYAISSIVDLSAGGLNLSFDVDVMGNIVHVATTGSEPPIPNVAPSASIPVYQRNYEYDALQRLSVATRSGAPSIAEQYTYNKTGDRLSVALNGSAPTTYAYAPGTHRLESAGPLDVRTHDANGNQTSLASSPYPLVYDDSNRLSSVTFDGMAGPQIYAYAYNGMGERVYKGMPNGSSSLWTYDAGGRVLSQKGNPSGTSSGVGMLPAGGDTSSITEYIYLGNLPVAQFKAATASISTLYYIETDHLGTPRRVFDPTTDANVWRWDLLASSFGAVAPDENPLGVGAYVLDLRFPGQYYDQESGLHYNYYRNYEAGTGRYIESDPIGLGGGFSTYAYVGGIPTSSIDPLGLAGCYVGFPDYPITIPGTKTKFPLTHAGVLSYDSKGGTRYYEYGRYDSDFGDVHRRTVPDLTLGPDGLPTAESWAKMRERLKEIGHGTESRTMCDAEADADKINRFAEQRKNDKNRDPYSWNPFNFNTCTTFASDAYEAGR